MWKTFKQSWRIRNACRVNQILTSIRQIPIIGKEIPNTVYGIHGFKVLGLVLSILMETIGQVVKRALYLGLMVYLAAAFFGVMHFDSSTLGIQSFAPQLFVFLTIIGGMLNTNIMEATEDSYYGIMLLRLSAREYGISNLLYQIIKMMVDYGIILGVFGLLFEVPAVTTLSLLLWVPASKLSFGALAVRGLRGKGIKGPMDFSGPAIFVSAVLLAAAYILTAVGIQIPAAALQAALVVFLCLAVIGLIYIWRYPDFYNRYRMILTGEIFSVKDQANRLDVESLNERIEWDEDQKDEKNGQDVKAGDAAFDMTTEALTTAEGLMGYPFLHKTFVRRHQKLLYRRTKRITIVLLVLAAIWFVVQGIIHLVGPFDLFSLITLAPFGLYFLNTGEVVTQTMFANCDASLLTYNFYRKPEVVLGVFKERIKTMILVNLPPALVLGLGLAVPQVMADRVTRSMAEYVFFVICILSISVFFSVHRLVLYYLLQPYNEAMEMKNTKYRMANGATYIVCYILYQVGINVEMPAMPVAIIATAFCIIYTGIAYFLAYRLAPKTFRIRRGE